MSRQLYLVLSVPLLPLVCHPSVLCQGREKKLLQSDVVSAAELRQVSKQLVTLQRV